MAKLFLIGNHRPSLALARALQSHGHEIWAGSNGYSDYFELSHSVAGSIAIPGFDDERDCIAAIARAVIEHRFDAIIPVTDRATRLVAAHRIGLERLAAIVSPAPQTVSTCVSKTAMAEICAEIGVSLAPYEKITCLEEVRAAGERLGYPLVIKPTGEGEFIHGQKVVALHAADELDSKFASWPDGHEALLVQRRLDGHRINHYFVAKAGRLVTGCEIEILRTDRPDGSGYAVEGITRAPRGDLRRQTEALVARLNYSGAGCAQYMTQANGLATSFLEINPRLGANFGGAEAAGAGMSEAMLALALDGDVPVPVDPWGYARPGVRYAWSKGEMSGLAWAARNGAGALELAGRFARLLWTGLRADTHMTFDLQDPLPGLACWFHPLIKRMQTSQPASGRSKVAG